MSKSFFRADIYSLPAPWHFKYYTKACSFLCCRTWEEGKVLIFDDSFEHEVWQDAENYRLIFIVDVWHPELTAQQRRTLPAI